MGNAEADKQDDAYELENSSLTRATSAIDKLIVSSLTTEVLIQKNETNFGETRGTDSQRR